MTNIGFDRNHSCCHHDHNLQDPLLWCHSCLYDRSCVAKVAANLIIVLVFISVAIFVSYSRFLVFLVTVIVVVNCLSCWHHHHQLWI